MNKQVPLFEKDEKKQRAYKHWGNMPEYKNFVKEKPEIVAKFKFRTKTDFEHFKKLLTEHVYHGRVFDGMQREKRKQAWFPLREKASNYRYVSSKKINPQFPVYVVSRGRWTRRPTCNTLDEMGVPYKVLVEPEEYENYVEVLGRDKVMFVPELYRTNYDTFWDDKDPRKGAGSARNYAWYDALSDGVAWHWVMDDNIESFERFNHNMKIKCLTGAILRMCEDFVLRYENIAIAGLNYAIFCPDHEARPPFILNTRIYSCLLIRNDIPYRWRGRYNEDTDLCLRALKDGWCTVQFNCALQGKRATQSMNGGNTEQFYSKEGTYLKSKMLVDMHPDVAKLTKRFNRWHHYVNYRPFKKNKLILKKGLTVPKEPNNYGMKLIKIKRGDECG